MRERKRQIDLYWFMVTWDCEVLLVCGSFELTLTHGKKHNFLSTMSMILNMTKVTEHKYMTQEPGTQVMITSVPLNIVCESDILTVFRKKFSC